MQLSPYTYTLVRFVPDPVRGEMVNLGVVVVSDEEKLSGAAFLPYPRLRRRVQALAPDTNAGLIRRITALLTQRADQSRQPTLFPSHAEPLVSTRQLSALRQAMSNQLQLSETKSYRAALPRGAVDELYADLALPPKRGQRPPTKGMTLRELRELIADTISNWAAGTVTVEEASLERVDDAHHFADFWLQAGHPIAALLAYSEEPDDRHAAWFRRDAVPTIATVFRRVNPEFKTVAVFPPNGHQATEFTVETKEFLGALDGVIVTHGDHLSDLRGQLVPTLV